MDNDLLFPHSTLIEVGNIWADKEIYSWTAFLGLMYLIRCCTFETITTVYACDNVVALSWCFNTFV